jgi:hypothetical protein
MPRAYIRHDLLIEAGDPAPVLRDPLRIEGREPIPRHRDVELAGLRQQRLPAVAVTAVGPATATLTIHVMVHLGVQHPFRQRPLQVVEQAVLAENRLRIPARQQPVQEIVCDNRLLPSCHAMSPPLASSWCKERSEIGARKRLDDLTVAA